MHIEEEVTQGASKAVNVVLQFYSEQKETVFVEERNSVDMM